MHELINTYLGIHIIVYLGANNESRDGRSVTGVQGSVLEVLNKSVIGGLEKRVSTAV